MVGSTLARLVQDVARPKEHNQIVRYAWQTWRSVQEAWESCESARETWESYESAAEAWESFENVREAVLSV
jgi:hypothetical protein